MNEEQQMLLDSAQRYLRDTYDFNSRRDMANSEQYISTTHWQAFAEMGWLAMPFGEQHGGLGFGMEEVALLSEEFGKHLVLEPMLESTVVAGSVLTYPGVAVESSHIDALVSGEKIYALAHQEPDTTADIDNLSAHAQHVANGLKITGNKAYISAGAVTDYFIVTAKLEGQLALFLVPKDAEGLTVTRYKTYDGRSAANLAFDMELPFSSLMARGDLARSAFMTMRDRAILGASAEALGAMQAALDTTVDYTRQRVQFGKPLSSFQALQHRMANMLIQIELCRSLVGAACRALDAGSEDARRLTLAAKVKVTSTARKVTQEAIQLHGGIATTDEYVVGHYFKRVTALESWVCSREDALVDFIRLTDAA
ncbi:acyl-CoA dehydrogenase [Luminiphilus syltensis NOR5-1B]|uniref:Acyl-CoA dehydrogenase n=1 Tax=Luminiphilus syltensis NOR5-1B TaxID=565045 RepID=B8KSR4_9GAMM|nr:acyl-CoA dehydrogenase family protein [Luminiphilus syltensis]EED36787.1 acyl-CoA dehydrogenase [Luminiphilus syltensis NOR5-1B]